MIADGVGIIGIGVLGTVHKKWVERYCDLKYYTYDIEPIKSNSSFEELVWNSEYIFICLPTNEKDLRLDISIINDTIKKISELTKKEKQKVIIRSTLRIGSCLEIEQTYPNLEIIFIPEFLTERFAWDDFIEPERTIIGMNKIYRLCKEEIDSIRKYKVMPISEHMIFMNTNEAEAVKLFTNSFYALRVIFANEIHDLCMKMNLDYHNILSALRIDPRIGSDTQDLSGRDVHFRIAQDGKVGFGGKCLPKDLAETVSILNEKKAGFGLLEKVENINERIRK